MSKPPVDIRELQVDEVQLLTEELGEKPYRGKQLWEWLWKKRARSWDDMSDLPKTFRAKLAERCVLRPLVLAEEQKSEDGTVKCAFRTWDGHIVEGVLIPTPTRLTACISSQIGCSLTCSFCATGKLKRVRNLETGEIVDQVVLIDQLAHKYFDQGLTNIVYMGMGEPLLNYRNVLESVERICGTPGLGMSPRRITVSTAGIAKAIVRLGDDRVKFNLALSLHAANDLKRSKIMAINDSNNLEALGAALRHFHACTESRVTFEYIIFDGFNDGLEDARELAAFCRNVPCKVNIIEYNPIEGGEFRMARADKVADFVALLEDRNLIVNVRRSRGKDIDAACGQLVNNNTWGAQAVRKSTASADAPE